MNHIWHKIHSLRLGPLVALYIALVAGYIALPETQSALRRIFDNAQLVLLVIISLITFRNIREILRG